MVVGEGGARGWLAMAGAASAVLVAVAGGVGAVAVWGGNDAGSSAAAGPSTEVPFDVRVGDYGIWITTEVTFPDEVTLSDPTLQVDDSQDSASLWPLDGRDHEGEDLDPLTVPAGTSVAVSGMTRPLCDNDQLKAVHFTLAVSRHNGSPRIHEYSPENLVAMPPAVRRWCAQGPTVTAGTERLEPDGDAVIGVYVTNPGPKSITVAVPAYADEHVSWAGTTAVAPPSERADGTVASRQRVLRSDSGSVGRA